MNTAAAAAALRALSIPTSHLVSNQPPVTVGGVVMLRSNLNDALDWALAIVRASRKGDLSGVLYASGWISHCAHELNAIADGLAVFLINAAENADAADLAELDAAACDAIEHVRKANGTGRYVDGRLVARPSAFAA